MIEKPNYVKEAVKEPYNIWLLFLCVAASLFIATQDIPLLAYWMPLAAGVVGELLYLTAIPSSAQYRRLVDRRMRQKELVERGRRREDMIKQFDPREREAVEYLKWMKHQIYQNYQKFTRSQDIPDNIQRLDGIWDSYVDILDIYRRRKNHMRSANRQTIKNQIQQTERAIQTAPDDDTRRLYEKNLDILQRRMNTYNDIERSIKRVEAQLQSIESFFGLVNDQVVTMPTPEHISSLDFDSLLSSIELTKEILEETAPVLNSLDFSERTAEPVMRPPIAQKH
jgi:hypothetical protein